MIGESGCWVRDFWLQFAGGLSHFGIGPSAEASADESPGVHHLGEVHPLKEKKEKKNQKQQLHACFCFPV